MAPWDEIGHAIADATGERFAILRAEPIGGGGVNRAYRLRGRSRSYFAKLNEARCRAMFEAEAAGLDELARSRTVRVPRPVCAGSNTAASWLLLEWIDLREPEREGMGELGRQLARLHRVTGARYGWDRDNTIGATPQRNGPGSDWTAFWLEQRLGFQLDLAARNGHRARLHERGARLAERLPSFFAGHQPAPSLLHGDLWRGNAGFGADGAPVIYDPAVYFGDREADLAMTELFGGFTPDFYAAYRAAFPLDAGYERRKHLYNLYHVLNHLNLFGGGYAAQAEAMIDALLKV